MNIRMWILFSFLCASRVVFGSPDVALAESDTAFTLIKSNDGVFLYERWYQMHPDLHAREVKATLVLNTDVETAVAMIANEQRGREWNKNTREYRVVALDENQWVSYLQYNLPWPLSNQDCVLEHTRYRQGSTVHISFRAVEHHDFPINNRVERIDHIRGRWVFRPEGNHTQVEYYITTLPNGAFPAWLTDPVIRNNLIASLQAFRDIVQREALSAK